MKGGLCVTFTVLAVLLAPPAAAQQRGSQDFYELGDYDMFANPAAPKPRPAPSPVVPAQTPAQPSPSAPKPAALPVHVQAMKVAPAARAQGPIAAYQQGDLAAARAEAKALAGPAREAAAGLPTAPGAAAAVPNYAGTALPQATLFDDPDALVSQGTTASIASDPYRAVVDPDRSVVRLDRTEIARAIAVEKEPDAFLDGEALSSGAGACRPLPPSTAGEGWYEATCNTGLKMERADLACRIPLVVEVERSPDRYQYHCEDTFDRWRRNGPRLCTPFEPALAAGTCREVAREYVGMTCLQGQWPNCTEPGDPIYELTLQCDAPTTPRPYTLVPGGRIVSELRDEGQCQATGAGMTCDVVAETCVDAAPETRDVNGLAVTSACWAWQRTLSCHRTTPANDCGALEANAQCRFDREICLDDPQAGACKVKERIYRCPVPGGAVAGGPEYICGDDVYCINGECEPIVREASTELKDALVGLHTLGQAKAEFDEATLTLFSGTRESCHKPVFGLVNCCAGKTSGALTAAAGLVAIAGGPAAIAALATPFLSMFMCSTREMTLDIKDRMGFCHKVGTWCSDSFLGVCTSKRTAYCCFESKLSRILQEQGRTQLGKPWGEPKREQCRGFSVDEFARLDLSRMDFTEVYAEFIDAAKLPNEVATARAIQERIEAYYRPHGPR